MSQIFPVQLTFEDSTAYILARVRGTTNQYITQASLSSINLRVYDKDAPPETDDEDDDAVIAARDLTIASDVFDDLQTDSGWTLDATGFNVKVEVLPADIPRGNKVYIFEHKFTNASAKIWHMVVEVPTLGLYRS